MPTGEQSLRFHAVLYHVPPAQVEERIGRVLRLVALEDRRHDLVSTFSGGMARRLEIARGMLHTPACSDPEYAAALDAGGSFLEAARVTAVLLAARDAGAVSQVRG